jgi:acyl-coenzyme A thioesterase PaaI-like protein
VADRSAARNCYGCGTENHRGLGMHFELQDGRAVAEFTAASYLQGYPGRVHGGGVATMLDEAMGWAAYAQGAWAVTAKMTLRFRAAVPLEEPLTVSGWATRDRGRTIELRAELRDRKGTLLAEADGVFVRVAGKLAEELRRQYEASLT